MYFGIKDCLDLKMFSYEGKEVYSLNYANNCKLEINKDKAYLLFNHEVTSFELIQLQQNGVKEELSDFEKELQTGIEINFTGEVDETEYKAIGVFTIREEKGSDIKVKLVFNSLRFDANKEFLTLDCENINSFNTGFIINRDKDGNLFKMIARN